MKNDKNSTSDNCSNKQGGTPSTESTGPRSGPLSRRTLLQSVGAVGAASGLLTMLAGAEQTGNELTPVSAVDGELLGSIFQTPEVRQLRRTYPTVALKPEGVHSLHTDSNDQVIAANVAVAGGTLAYLNVHDTTQVTVSLDQRRPDVIADWPLGTEGMIKATVEKATFIRTATEDEQERVLDGIGGTRIENADDSDVFVAPETDSYLIQKFDYEGRRIEVLAVSAGVSSTGGSAGNYQIDAQHVVGSGGQTGVGIAGSCNINEETAVDVYLCLHQLTTCTLCAPSIVGGPIAAVACLLLVCFGSVTAVTAYLDEVDFGCTALISDVLDCWDEWTQFY